MTDKPLDPHILTLCHRVTGKRPKTVVTHILKHGFITSEDLKDTYGYDHPPRAIRDVRELGIPIHTFRVTSKSGKSIAAYRFGEISAQGLQKKSGRVAIAKFIRDALIKKHGNRCSIYLERVDPDDLQVDHRIPYEVIPTESTDTQHVDDFMLLCASANRLKSWSCENCKNWTEIKDESVCRRCYWAFPESYDHIAMLEVRRLDLMWQGADIDQYESLVAIAEQSGQSLQEFVKALIAYASRTSPSDRGG